MITLDNYILLSVSVNVFWKKGKKLHSIISITECILKEGEIITLYYQYHWMYPERREIITLYYQYHWMYSERRGAGMWKCHARLARFVHITDRTSNFLCIGCPWTSENWPCSGGGNQISFDNCQKIIKYDITKICNYVG